MRNYLFFAGLIFLMQTSAAGQSVNYEIDASASELTFKVDSTLHEVHGEADIMPTEVAFDAATGTVSGPIKISIPVSELNTHHNGRDKEMRKMFDSENYPVITWRSTEISCEPLSGQPEINCDVKGYLKIRNSERSTSFPVTLTPDGDVLWAVGRWEFERKDFDLETPSVLGIIRVAQPVSIEFHTLWVHGADS